jgi:hypothetical protein
MATSSGLLQPVISWLAFHLKISLKRSLFEEVSEREGEVGTFKREVPKKKTTQKKAESSKPSS